MSVNFQEVKFPYRNVVTTKLHSLRDSTSRKRSPKTRKLRTERASNSTKIHQHTREVPYMSTFDQLTFKTSRDCIQILLFENLPPLARLARWLVERHRSGIWLVKSRYIINKSWEGCLFIHQGQLVLQRISLFTLQPNLPELKWRRDVMWDFYRLIEYHEENSWILSKS